MLFAYTAAQGKDVSKLEVTQEDLRDHICHCFEQQELTPFPLAYTMVQKSEKKHMWINTYCVCGLPESYDSHMIMCDKCEGWFHFRCVGISTTLPPDTWACTDCDN